MKNPFFSGAGRREGARGWGCYGALGVAGAGRREAGVAVGRSAWRARNGRAGRVAAGTVNCKSKCNPFDYYTFHCN